MGLYCAEETCANSAQNALEHVWLSGKTASDHNLLPEIRAYVAKARLRRGIELVKLANRIEALKMQEDEEEDVPGEADVPAGAHESAGEQLAARQALSQGLTSAPDSSGASSARPKPSLSRVAKGAIFREVVLAKVREMKDQEAQKEFEKSATQNSKTSGSGSTCRALADAGLGAGYRADSERWDGPDDGTERPGCKDTDGVTSS